MRKNDGGLAFPGGRITHTDNIDEGHPMNEGMSMRDYFAGQVLAGMVSGGPDLQTDGAFYIQFAVPQAYNIADAMIEEREKTS